MQTVFTYIILTVLTVVNIIIPIPGSSIVTPILATLTSPQKALALASFYFFMSAIIRVTVFRKNINWIEIKEFLPISVLCAIIGVLITTQLPERILLLIILFTSTYFLLQKIGIIKTKTEELKSGPCEKKSGFEYYFQKGIGALSGFLQGAGISASDLRNNYLLAKGMSVSDLHGTSAFIGGSIFLTSIIVRLCVKQVTLPDLLPLLWIFPFMILGTLAGKKILTKLDKKTHSVIVVLIMLLSIVFLTIKILKFVF